MQFSGFRLPATKQLGLFSKDKKHISDTQDRGYSYSPPTRGGIAYLLPLEFDPRGGNQMCPPPDFEPRGGNVICPPSIRGGNRYFAPPVADVEGGESMIFSP